jgi:hypothetical protein
MIHLVDYAYYYAHAFADTDDANDVTEANMMQTVIETGISTNSSTSRRASHGAKNADGELAPGGLVAVSIMNRVVFGHALDPITCAWPTLENVQTKRRGAAQTLEAGGLVLSVVTPQHPQRVIVEVAACLDNGNRSVVHVARELLKPWAILAFES